MSKEAAPPVTPDRTKGVFGTHIGAEKRQSLPHSTSGSERRRKPSRTGGFTLIELVIVVTVLGLLAGIAIASYGDVRGKAYLALLKSDLKNISYYQELYFTNNNDYAQNTQMFDEYSPSPDVILTMVATQEGWTARGTHKADTKYRCAIFSGTVAMNFAPSADEGAIACVTEPGQGGGPP